MKVIIKGYNEVKWEAEKKAFEIEYDDVKNWKVVGGCWAVEIEKDIDEEMIDEYHEYLVIEFYDGETATFRNSHVDMFKA